MCFKKLLLCTFCYLLPFALCAENNEVRTTPLTGTVALTFDDGPSPTYTPQILAILKKYQIKATFFMMGTNAKKYPTIVKQVQTEGHAIASHSLTHPKLTQLNNAALYKEIVIPQQIIYAIIGKKPTCLRYPFGLSNPRVRAAIRAQGIIPVSMGFNSFDYENRGVTTLVNWLLKNVHAGQVILLHDGYDKRQQTVDALPQIIEGIQRKGLGFSQICKEA